MTYFSVHQEMKSKLENRATGETEIASNTSFAFDFDVNSLLYYDPLTLKLGHQIHAPETHWYFALEFQQWDKYEASTLKLKKRGGAINGSDDYEKIKLKNIFIPRIGFEKQLSDKWVGKMGYFYRQSPIYTNNLKNSGNSIDVDKHVVSLGAAHLVSFYNKIITLDLAYQAHLLRSMQITKTPNLEDGTPDNGTGNPETKIGSPGYEVGGMIHVLTLGANWKY